MFWDRLLYRPYGNSMYGLSFIMLYSILFVLLFVQIIRNNKIFWLLNLGLFVAHILYSVGWVFWDTIKKGGISVSKSNGSILEIVFFSLLLIAISIVIYVLYKMKPKRLL